ncbi:MAG TPA: hypothetical protein VLX92_17810 [Kofleriaceae bacterium]|nr:hypothetical protein [Kofleriaceae bacterium]
MMRIPRAAGLVLALAACGPGSRSGDDQSPTTHLEIDPPDASVTVMDGVAVVQAYTATLVDAHGHRTDVTQTATFSLADLDFGAWSGPSLTVTGAAAGPTMVMASDGQVTGSTGLTVYVQGERDDGTVPPDAGALFAGATETVGHAPNIVYPAAGITVPPNLGEFDVHWTDSAGNDLFQIELKNQYVDLTIYKQTAAPAYTTYTPAEWFALASPAEPLSLTVAGLATADPAIKGTTAPQDVETTNEQVAGGCYYWTTEPTQGVYRYDMSTPSIPPSPYFTASQQPTSCIGCHGLSHDGTKMALTLDQGNGRGTIYDVGSQTVLVPFATNPQYWNFATFNADATKVVTVFQGQMSLRATMGGAILASIPSDPGYLATHPELSPDGTMLANVETTSDYYDFQVSDGTIVTRSYDDATGTFGPIKQLVANAAGASNYYPSWSPDGQWILFTRTSGNSYNDASAQVWVVKADGSMPPIQLVNADLGPNLTDSWARWTPFMQTFGAQDETLYYFTFSTTRPFGVRATGGTQIWMAPFFPDRAAAGMDPSGPAFHMPFQLLTSSNHIAQWTDAVVIGRNTDGSPRTQAQAVREASAR